MNIDIWDLYKSSLNGFACRQSTAISIVIVIVGYLLYN